MARCVVVLADGLRPDVVTPRHMPMVHSLGEAYTRAARAETVTPSVTVAALASLATGVAPSSHGLVEPGLSFLSRLGTLRPMARELTRHRVSSLAVAGALAPRSRPVAWTLAACAGVTRLVGARAGARDIVRTALPYIARQREGLVFVYLPDCDRVGHAHGWMSELYLEAARDVDAATRMVTAALGDALLIVMSDHGGGGVSPTDHDADHPLNRHIPLVLAGPTVRRQHVLEGPVSLLDVPPTILAWLGVAVPPEYEGRVLADAFAPAAAAVA